MPRRVRALAPKMIHEQLADACLKAAKANHYLIYVRPPVGLVIYDDANHAAQIIMDRHNCGRISCALENRALILLADATGYSLTDLNA